MNFIVKKLLNKIYRYLQRTTLNKKFCRNENELANKFNKFSKSTNSLSLDLGSGPKPKNPFGAQTICGADLRSSEINNVVYADLAGGKLPFDDNFFDFVTAYDLLEHIQRVLSINGEVKFPFIQLMNEIFRVLKPGGILFNIQPCYPFKEAFQDPTHVNIMTEDTIYFYFCEPSWARIYGFEGSFIMMEDGWLNGKYFSFIKKSTNAPIKNLEFVQK